MMRTSHEDCDGFDNNCDGFFDETCSVADATVVFTLDLSCYDADGEELRCSCSVQVTVVILMTGILILRVRCRQW